MVIDFSNISDICINKKAMSCLYRNNILIWAKKQSDDAIPLFVASSLDVGTYYSYDGRRWQTNQELKQLKFTCLGSQGSIVVGGTADGWTYKSYDGGLTWTKYEIQLDGKITAMANGNGLLLAATTYKSSNNVEKSSLWYLDNFEHDGYAWTRCLGENSTSPIILPAVNDLSFNTRNGTFLAATQSGLYSPNSSAAGELGTTNWTQIENSQLMGFNWTSLYVNTSIDSNPHGISIIASSQSSNGSAGGMLYSIDRYNYEWHSCNLTYHDGQTLNFENGNWKNIIYNYDLSIFIANSINANIFGSISSSNGIDWQFCPSNEELNLVEYGHNRYVAAFANTVGLKYSFDMVDWNTANGAGQSNYDALSYYNPHNSIYMTGTTLKYSNTSIEKVQACSLMSSINDVGIKF